MLGDGQGEKGGGGGGKVHIPSDVVCGIHCKQANRAQRLIWTMPYRITRCTAPELKPGHPFRSLVIINSGITIVRRFTSG
jgi:hypothetical protein